MEVGAVEDEEETSGCGAGEDQSGDRTEALDESSEVAARSWRGWRWVVEVEE